MDCLYKIVVKYGAARTACKLYTLFDDTYRADRAIHRAVNMATQEGYTVLDARIVNKPSGYRYAERVAREDANGVTARRAYNDGRTDGRTFCREHSQEDRAVELARVNALDRDSIQSRVDRQIMLRYYDGYTEILSTWVDGIGA